MRSRSRFRNYIKTSRVNTTVRREPDFGIGFKITPFGLGSFRADPSEKTTVRSGSHSTTEGIRSGAKGEIISGLAVYTDVYFGSCW